MELLVIFVSSIVSIALTIGFFILFINVNKIKKEVCKPTYNEQDFWIEKKLGNTDKAHDILLRMYLEWRYNNWEPNPAPAYAIEMKAYIEEMKEKFKSIGKELPDFED